MNQMCWKTITPGRQWNTQMNQSGNVVFHCVTTSVSPVWFAFFSQATENAGLVQPCRNVEIKETADAFVAEQMSCIT